MATFTKVSYPSDDGSNYALRISETKAANAAMDPASPGQAEYPGHWTPRLTHGKTADGLHHASIPTSAANGLFDGGAASFTYGGKTYIITGRTGEKRPNLAPKF